MNRAIRRELERREVEKNKTRIPFLLDKSSAEKMIQSKNYEQNILKANRLGRIQGLDRMYSVVQAACDRVKGIGPKRKEALKVEIVNIIMEIGDEIND